MGTSNAYGGAGGGTPLIPSWLQGEGDGGAGAGDGDGTQSPSPNGSPPAVPPAPAPRPTAPAGASDRFTSARNNFTRFVSSGASDRRSLGRAVSQYVSKSAGGSRQAAQRMGSSRGAGAGLVRFLNDASANGVRSAANAQPRKPRRAADRGSVRGA